MRPETLILTIRGPIPGRSTPAGLECFAQAERVAPGTAAG